ncbi:TIGR04255 family protein [Methanobrevibacter sp.]|uniref:TIGR04255 family protein n=1 Tax=Methanobrevibacter sp. TaxID=66852 RepID=UPI00388E9379
MSDSDYKKNYLTEVIFRINFSNILKLAGDNKEAADKFQKEIFEEFPNVHFQYNKNVNIQVDIKEGNSQSTVDEGDLTWIFSDENNFKQVELNSKNLILVYHKGAYNGFDKFLNDVSVLLRALRWYSPFKVTFLGLRYINQIHEDIINEKNIKEYINNDLINNIIFNLNENENFSQLFSRLDLLQEDYHLTFQFGFFNPKFPEITIEKDFILDYDCRLIKDDSVNSQRDIEIELTNMNEIIKEKFNYSISDKLRKLMGGKNDSD